MEENEQRFGIKKLMSIASRHYSYLEKLMTFMHEVAATLGFTTVIKISKRVVMLGLIVIEEENIMLVNFC